MDTHITTMDFAVVDDAGRLVKTATIATGASAFIKFVKSVPPPRTVYMEESLLEEIYHPVGERRRFRELIESYHDTVRMTTRI